MPHTLPTRSSHLSGDEELENKRIRKLEERLKTEEARNKELNVEMESLKQQLLKAGGENASAAIANESAQV